MRGTQKTELFLRTASKKGLITIDSEVAGLWYVVDKEDKSKLTLVTLGGSVDLNRRQVKALAAEVREVMEVLA